MAWSGGSRRGSRWLLTDSNVCLPRGTTRRLGIRIVPITILLDGASVADDSVDPTVVFDAIARDDTVKSSPPSVIDYLDCHRGRRLQRCAGADAGRRIHVDVPARHAGCGTGEQAGTCRRHPDRRGRGTRSWCSRSREAVRARLEDLEQIARDAAGRGAGRDPRPGRDDRAEWALSPPCRCSPPPNGATDSARSGSATGA